MDTLKWENVNEVNVAKTYINKYITTWIQRDDHGRNPMVRYSTLDDPCLLSTTEIFIANLVQDYKKLINCIQQHSKCTKESHL